MPPSAPPDPATLTRPWTAAYPPGVPADYLLPTVAVPRFLDDAVRDFPHRAALLSGRDAIDHATLRDRVAHLAELLRGGGVAAGDRVLVGLPDRASLPTALLAIWRLAAIAVPVPTDLTPERLRRIVADAGCTAVIGNRRLTRHVADADADDVDPDEVVHEPRTVVVLDGDDWLFPTRRGRIRRLLRRTRPGAGRTSLPAAGTSGVSVGPRVGPAAEDVALLSYDDRRRGTDIGPPLAHTHGSLVAAAFQARLWVPDVQAGRERTLVAAPLWDPAGLALGLGLGLLAGATVVCVDAEEGVEVARVIDRERPTLAVLTPDGVGNLLTEDAGKRDLTSLRVVLTAGGPSDPVAASALERRTGAGRVRGCFGVPGAPLVHAQPVYGRSAPDAIGLPVTGTAAAVVDPDHLDVLCAVDAPGRLVVHGPQVAGGTWRDGALRAADPERFRDGWLLTDAFVTLDGDGVFHHLGALGEVIARHDTWVSPRRIEAVLVRHSAVRAAGVVAGPTPGSLHAAVVCGRRGRPDEEALLVHCRAHLDSPAVPDHVILLDELPQTDTGELARDRLRELLAER